MKKFRLALAGLLALGAGVQAALTNTINVTTTADEDNTNPAACSLREAIKAVNLRAPYGGCPAGHPFNDNLIQLAPGDYFLTEGELVVAEEVEIAGDDEDRVARNDQIEPLTGQKPRRVRPDYVDTETTPIGTTADPDTGPVGTNIIADASSRIFYSTSAMTVRDVVLTGSDAGGTAVDGNGGVIYSVGPLFLTNVIIRDGRVASSGGPVAASGNGGAIYMAGDGSNLALTEVTLESNVAANTGGAVAMLCSVNLNPYALHSVTIKRSLFKDNVSVGGAGAIDMCGLTTASISSSTFARNSSFMGSASAPDSAAIAYVQSGNPRLGQLTLVSVTAAEQTGHVLALTGLESVTLQGSLLAFNTSAEVCFNPDLDPDTDTAADIDAPMMQGTPSGTYNAITAGGSCDPLLLRPATGDSNKDIPLAVPLSQVLGALTTNPAFTPGGPFGLTEYYLPNEATPTYVIDQGGSFDNCAEEDQRNIGRGAGVACDIGAVERLPILAEDDDGRNSSGTDRKAIIDVLDNDVFGEDVTGPFQFPGFVADDTGTAGVNEGRPVELVIDNDGNGGLCVWKEETLSDDTTAGRVVVTSANGELRGKDDPIVCTYRVHNSNGDVSATGTITVQIANIAPRAKNDVFLRPVGTSSIIIDPLENDDDSGDGIYGLNNPLDPDSGPNWIDFYPPIEVTVMPQLGELRGVRADYCPGKSAGTTCYEPPLEYIAKNSLAPFSDTFSYRVYDQDGDPSNTAVVTITTDASDLDHGGGGGSLDLLGGLILGLLGLRRLRRL